MNKLVSTILLVAAVIFFSGFSLADEVEFKGIGIVSYGGKSSSKKPSDIDKQAAIAEAKRTAWRNFVAKQNPAVQESISKNNQYFQNNLDQFITDTTIIDFFDDKNLKTLTVAVRVGFNDTAVRQFLQQSSVSNNNQTMRSSDSVFTFLFMARKQTSIKQFGERVTEIQKSTTARNVAADGAVSRDSIVQSGGNTLRKEDEVTYSVSSNQDLDSAMGEVISTSGIEYVAYEDTVSNCGAPAPKSFQNEYVSSDEMSPKTRNAVISALKSCDVRYFAVGTVDSGVSSRDPVSGGYQVYVSVRAQLWDISQKLPRKVGSVAPKQYSGIGPDQGIASKNALNKAAKDLATSLVDQLNAKSIR